MSKQTRWKALFACVALVLMLVIVYSGLRILESAVFLQQDAEPEKSKTITRDGVEYFPRQDITVLLLMGIGEWGEVAPKEPNAATAADMITLMIFDEKEEEVTLLSLNRDTMTIMQALDEAGYPDGRVRQQLALAHCYGTGLEDSCENMVAAVSELLGGIRIDHYLSTKLDAIAIMNDAVGGVTVTVKDDFSAVDPSITMGEYTLQGRQAVAYVQTRRVLEDSLNVSRMERHREFLDGFLPALRSKMGESDTFAISAYEKISPYIVTDCSVNTLTGMMQRYTDYSIAEYVSPEGDNVLGKEYYEFYPDEEKLDDLILRLFYAPKN